MAFAAKTEVPVEKSIAEIIGLVKRAGAVHVLQYEEPTGFTVQFEIMNRLVRFRVPLPTLDEMPTRNGNSVVLTKHQRIDRRDQACRQRARALKLVIHAKLESVESGVETFEQVFLPNIVLSNGETVYDRVKANIAVEYQSAAPTALMLEGPRS